MEYEILRVNDDQTVRVRMTIGGRVLEQDFPMGSTEEELVGFIKHGLAVFNAEISGIPESGDPPYSPSIGHSETVEEGELPDPETGE